MRDILIFIYLQKVVGYKRRTLDPVIKPYFIMKAKLPSNLGDLERLMAMVRREADRIIQREGLKARDIEIFTIHRLGLGKGKYRTELVNVFRNIGVDKKGRIIYMTAPRQSINPEAYRIYLEYNRRKAFLTNKKEDRDTGIAKYIGIRQSKPEVKIHRMTKYKNINSPIDVNPLDLIEAKSGEELQHEDNFQLLYEKDGVKPIEEQLKWSIKSHERKMIDLMEI
jgi:hypothetical protein